MKLFDENGIPPVAIDINNAPDIGDYDRKARHLGALIRHATGNDIASFSNNIQQCLDALASTAATLGLDSGSTSSISAALSKLSSDQVQVQLHLIHLRKAEEELRAALALARHRQGEVASWKISVGRLGNDTAALERQRKSLVAKAKEYQQELSLINSEGPSEQDVPSITSLIDLQELLRKKDADLKRQKAQLEVFKGLPPNLELARQELANARQNQIRLMNTREKLLGRMTHGLT